MGRWIIFQTPRDDSKQICEGAGMRDPCKTKKQLVEEVEVLRNQLIESKKAEANRKRVEEANLSSGVAFAARNITERKRAEDKIHESKQLLEKTFVGLRDALLIIDANTLKILDCNPAALEIFGYDRNETIGQSVKVLHVDEKTNEEFRSRLLAAVETKGFLSRFEFRMKRRDGKIFPTEHNVMPIEDEEGNRIRWVSMVRDITEPKRAEEKLRESEKKYRAVVEISPDGIAIASKGRHVFANQSLARIFGVSDPDELLGKPVMDYIHPDYREIVRERNEMLIGRGALAPLIEEKMIRADGTVICTEVAAAPLEYQGEQAVLAIIRDITARKQAEEALRESEATLRALINAPTDSVLLLDTKGVILDLNKIAAERLEKSRDELIGTLADDALPEDIARRRRSIISQIFETGREVRFEDERNGIWYDTVVHPIMDKDGEVSRLAIIARDITDRKHAEEALLQSEEKYRTILEEIEDGYFEVDLAGHWTFINDSMCKIHGYPTEELLGADYRQFLDEENGKKMFEAFNQIYATGESRKIFDYEFVRKDGTKRQVEVSASLKKDLSGKPIGFRGITRDITERKQAAEKMESLQEQLRQSQKMEAIGRLAGGIAHDFNNLLTIIKGYTQLSLIELKEDTPLKGNIEQVHRATDRAADLVRQLLAFSRRQILEMKVIDLNAILKSLHNMLRRVIGEDIELVTVLAEDLGRIRTDPGWIEQAIMNLVVNARDAMASGGKLTMETGNVDLDEAYTGGHVVVKPGHYVMLSVSDTGAGMTPEVMERLFEPFFSTKEKDKGTGLGLSTVYGIVKQSGGDIWVYSELGKGATFKIYLPRVDEPLEELREKVLGDQLLRGRETILLVEDEEDVRKLALRVLERQGYEVLAARDGDEALLICKQHKDPIHLMLTDVVMPRMSGHELAKRSLSLRPEMKVLYMSGYTDHAIVMHGILMEGVRYFQKPFTVDALAKKVREVLEQ
jgi:two-component system cell cycle sensor histidine kinase/response regulator CckA